MSAHEGGCGRMAVSSGVAGEDIPESERFVARPSDNALSVWRHGQIKHAVSVASERGNFVHLRVFPNDDLVERVSMSADKFISSL